MFLSTPPPPPHPDPAPVAIANWGGWMQVDHASVFVLRLPGRPGLWRCTVRWQQPMMRCRRVR